MTHSTKERLPSMLAMVLDTFSSYQEYVIPHLLHIPGEDWHDYCFRTVDAILVKRKGKWRNIGRMARIECYRAVHVDIE